MTDRKLRKLRLTLNGHAQCPNCKTYMLPYPEKSMRGSTYFPEWTCATCGATLKWNVYCLTLPMTLAASLLTFGASGGLGAGILLSALLSSFVAMVGIIAHFYRDHVSIVRCPHPDEGVSQNDK